MAQQHQSVVADLGHPEQIMRDIWLGNRVFTSYADILDHCRDPWNTLIERPWRIVSIGPRNWVHEF